MKKLKNTISIIVAIMVVISCSVNVSAASVTKTASLNGRTVTYSNTANRQSTSAYTTCVEPADLMIDMTCYFKTMIGTMPTYSKGYSSAHGYSTSAEIHIEGIDTVDSVDSVHGVRLSSSSSYVYYYISGTKY